MLDFFESLANVGDMKEETVSKLENMTPTAYFKKIYEKFREKNPDKEVYEFAWLVSSFLCNIKFSATDDDAYYHKIDDNFYVKFNDKVTNVTLYKLEKEILNDR